jgi:tetratricopeptide (TPR) repeat protein
MARRTLVLLVLLAVVAPSASADDWEDCVQERRLALVIKGCTRIIRSDPGMISAYYHRARAYERSGRIGRAIADRSRLIRLDPSSFAYRARDRLFRRRGEYKRALADFNKDNRTQPDRQLCLL